MRIKGQDRRMTAKAKQRRTGVESKKVNTNFGRQIRGNHKGPQGRGCG